MTLTEQRHPALGGLMRLWRTLRSDDGLPPASALRAADHAELARMSVMLAMDESAGMLVITESSEAVDALYGVALAGRPAAQLSPERDDAEQEARTAIATGRPLLIEDELRGARRRRIARLYLPLANDDGTPDGVLCGVVAVS